MNSSAIVKLASIVEKQQSAKEKNSTIKFTFADIISNFILTP
jgi:hypothetical protein